MTLTARLRAALVVATTALSRRLNALTGGTREETLSRRAGERAASGVVWGCVLCRALDFFDRDHCAKSVERRDGAGVPRYPHFSDLRARGRLVLVMASLVFVWFCLGATL